MIYEKELKRQLKNQGDSTMKYIYKNLKHVVLHGIKPGEEKEFDHPIEGGGIKLIEKKDNKPITKKVIEVKRVIKEED